MSGAIGDGFGLIPVLMRNIDQLNAQNNTLTAEQSTGEVSGSFAGLGDQAYEAISLGPQITAASTWQNNVSQLQSRLSVSQTALSGISSIATSLQSSLSNLESTSSTAGIAAASDSAKRALTQLTSLLNTQDGDNYVFAGAASDQAPVTSADLASSSMVSSIMNAVAQVGETGAAATEAATLASAGDNSSSGSVFSSQLSVSPLAAAGMVSQVQVGPGGATIATGVTATQGSAAGAQSTGSPIRDLIRSLATVAGLSGADPTSAGFAQLVSDTVSQVQTVMTGITGLVSQVGEAQSSATAQSSTLSDLSSALQGQLGSITGADQAAVRTQQVAVQDQLTASYTLIADMKALTLAQYL